MNDILIYSPTIHEHISRLKEVFQRLRKADLNIQPDKCELLRKEVAYLGVKPISSKVDAIINFPEPRNPKEINFFQTNFAKNVQNLDKTLTKKITTSSLPQMQKITRNTKKCFGFISNFNFDEPFVLQQMQENL